VQQKIQQVLVVNQNNNRRRNGKRRNFYRNKFNDVTTVMMVVQQVNVVNIQNNFVQSASLFALSAVTINQGRDVTQEVMSNYPPSNRSVLHLLTYHQLLRLQRYSSMLDNPISVGSTMFSLPALLA
jgi:hypothetical protein